MTRRLSLVATLVVAVGISAGCGKFGPPRRIGGPYPAASGAAPAPADQGSSILPQVFSPAPPPAPGPNTDDPEEDPAP